MVSHCWRRPVGILDWWYLVAGPAAGLDELEARVNASIVRLTEFVRQVVVHRRDFAVRGRGVGC